MIRMNKGQLTSFLAIAVIALLSTATMAQENDSREFDLSEQPLNDALKTVADEFDLQIAFFSETTKGIESVPLAGNYTAMQAFDELLGDTNLEHAQLDNGTVVVSARAELGDSNVGKSRPASRPVLMAQNQASAQQTQSNQTSPTSPSDEDNKPVPLEEIIVTGTHIRGVKSVGAAAITLIREEIDKTGFSTVGELFQSLPQNLDNISPDGALGDGRSTVGSNNSEGASSISLRGLGPGSTLVLLNGKRRPGSINGQAVDVSAIPLSMIERVEVVTGGRSAIYGSDAVAGVVNIVTVNELDGAETQVYYGEASAGGERFNISQSFGRSFENGSFVLGHDYRKDEALDLTDAGVARGPSTRGRTPIPGLYQIQRPSEQHAGLIAGRFELSDKAELYADVHFSAHENERGAAWRIEGSRDFVSTRDVDSDQYSATGGVLLDVGSNWQVDVSALYGVVDTTLAAASATVRPPDTVTNFNFPPTSIQERDTKLTSFSAIADGPLGTVITRTISAAIGIDFRNESFERTVTRVAVGTTTPQENTDRDILSVFGEVHLPLIDRDAQRLEVSLAGRYDDYSDFGNTFNSQIGVDWELISGVTFRGSYSEAFRAPELFNLAFGNQIVLDAIPDPLAPGGTTLTLGQFGGNPNLQPEEAETWTVGVDWESSDRSRLSLSYFNIEYDDRIDEPEPALFVVLTNENLLPGLINRNPTEEEVAEVISRNDPGSFFNFSGIPFDPATDDPLVAFPGLALFDGRRANIATEEVDGIDLLASTLFETDSGDWYFDLNATYYLNFTRKITATSPTIEQFNEQGKPVDLKLRGGIGWSRSAWNVKAYVNYVDSYDDTKAAIPTKIDSWTTVDLTVRYDTSALSDGGFLDGFKVALGFNNLFDEAPPEYLSHGDGIGYDSINANPVGRFVSLRLAKTW